MNDEGVKIYWMRDDNNAPVACLATKQRDNFIVYALSTHNPLDQFRKSIGRSIAITRLAGTQARAIINGPDVKTRIMQDIVASANTPQRARDSAQEWIEIEEILAESTMRLESYLCSQKSNTSTSLSNSHKTRPLLSQHQKA